MEKRTLGKTGLQVSALGFGGAEIGFEQAEASTVSDLLHAAIDAGLNLIDTAECYGSGDTASEQLIGQALGSRRDDVYLFTKVGHASGLDSADWDLAMLTQSIDRSLRRLKTDHVDLLQLHTCSEDLLRQGDVIDVLQKARDAGKTRFIGYSGDSSAALYAVECGQFDTLQTSVNIADQECIDLTLPKAKAANMGVIAKRPIANIAWRFTGESDAKGNYSETYWRRLQQLAYDFTRNGVTEESVQTALRFTLAAPAVCTAIVGTSKPDRWQQNAKFLDNGALPQDKFDTLHARWHQVASPDWTGQG